MTPKHVHVGRLWVKVSILKGVLILHAEALWDAQNQCPGCRDGPRQPALLLPALPHSAVSLNHLL